MLKLNFNVTEEKVSLNTAEENDSPAAGNINYIECCFNLPTAYDDLIVEAVFDGQRRALVNGVCTAPYTSKGECTVGVIAYELENEEYKLLSSPLPCTIYLPKGSFNNSVTESEQPLPGALEDYYKKIKDLIISSGGGNPDSNLKDITVIKSYEEYEAFFDNEEYMTELTESLQEGEYVLVVLIETDTGDGEPVTIITTMSKENGELVFNDGFSTGDLKEYIKDKIRESAKSLEKGLKAVTPVLDESLDLAFELKHNCEHRRYEPETLGSTWLQLLLPSELPKDFISGLVFVSGEKSRVFNYPDSIIFTGDDVIDDVLVPVANKVYNVVFWYDGINVNAVSRGVPYAKE